MGQEILLETDVPTVCERARDELSPKHGHPMYMMFLWRCSSFTHVLSILRRKVFLFADT